MVENKIMGINKTIKVLCLFGLIMVQAIIKYTPNVICTVILLLAGLLTIWLTWIWFTDGNKHLAIVVSLFSIGFLLQTVVRLANGGHMPVAPEYFSSDLPSIYIIGGQLTVLGDYYWYGHSPGDLILFAGFAYVVLVFIPIQILSNHKKRKVRKLAEGKG
jgi:hypothetical protein